VQALIDTIKALVGDLGDSYNMVYAALAFVAFLLVLVLVLSAIIRVVDRR